jgi:hypothetical protein
MEKITCKLAEYVNSPQGYGLLFPPTENDIWACILINTPKDKKYIKYIIKSEWINDESGTYTPEHTDLQIPLGVLTYWLDIYIQ